MLVKLPRHGDKRSPYAHIAKDLLLSPSEVHSSVQRARPLQGPEPGDSLIKAALQEFLIQGVKYKQRSVDESNEKTASLRSRRPRWHG